MSLLLLEHAPQWMAATSMVEQFGSMRPKNAVGDVAVIAADRLGVVHQDAIPGGRSLNAPRVVQASVLPDATMIVAVDIAAAAAAVATAAAAAVDTAAAAAAVAVATAAVVAVAAAAVDTAAAAAAV
ncbi:MAG: hypothetical protein P8R54_28385, partial [Myxococcota bacterium]|nr:hypothetical protein [Myxococcota bacterium]